MCEVLKVSTSGYYKWILNEPGEREEKKKEIMKMIRRIFHENRSVYGSPRITYELRDLGVCISEKTVGRYMKEMNLCATPKKKYIQTTDSNHSNPIYPNLLQRNFHSEAPDRVWVSDITYIWTSEGWLYLATVMDLFSRKIVGWSIDQSLTKDLALQALDRATLMREPSDELIHHSDRGSQYTSNEYIERLSEHDIKISMSRKGDCFDNACIESFHATIKKELIYRTHFKTREEAKWEVWKYIMTFYNAKRKHSTIDYYSPNQFERDYEKRKEDKVTSHSA